MDKRLYDASVYGNVDVLNALIKEDPLILHRLSAISLQENPLHIAAMSGRLDFVRAILNYEPKLAAELDSMGSSPLHLASVRGYVDIVRELLHARLDVTLVRDQDGRMPIHLAAMKGRIDVIEELFQAKHEAVGCKVGREETVLHLCVKHNRLEALKKIIELIGQNNELIVSKDEDENTILHLAASFKQVETIKYLVSNDLVKKNVDVRNGKGLTAIDLMEYSPRDPGAMEILTILQSNQPAPSTSQPENKIVQLSSWYDKFCQQWIKANQDNLMVVATLIATIAFQTGITPPGGVWQDFAKSDDTMIYIDHNDEYNNRTVKSINMKSFFLENNISHVPGSPVLQDIHPNLYKAFMYSNNISIISSLGIIFLLMSGFPLNNKFGMWLLVLAMTVSVAFTATTYATVITGISDLEENFPKPVNYWSWLETGFEVTQYKGIVIPIVLTLIAEIILFSIHTVGLFAWSIIKLLNYSTGQKPEIAKEHA